MTRREMIDRTIEAMVLEARKGNVEAAKLVVDFMGKSPTYPGSAPADKPDEPLPMLPPPPALDS